MVMLIKADGIMMSYATFSFQTLKDKLMTDMERKAQFESDKLYKELNVLITHIQSGIKLSQCNVYILHQKF
jgi:hypothetical protein